MSVETELSRIQADKNIIRAKFVELGIATSTDNLDTLAMVAETMINQRGVSVTLRPGESYAIPRGYHNGLGIVRSVFDSEVNPDICVVEITNSDNSVDDIGVYMFGTRVVDGTPTWTMSNNPVHIGHNESQGLLDNLGGGDGILSGSMFGLWLQNNQSPLNINTTGCDLVGSWEYEFYVFKADEHSKDVCVHVSLAT